MTPAKKEKDGKEGGELEELIATLRDKFGEGAIIIFF